MTDNAVEGAPRQEPQHVVPSIEAQRVPVWVTDAYEKLLRVLFGEEAPFPCFFAPEAERRGELAYTWLSAADVDAPTRLHDALREFLDADSFRSNRAGLVVLCQLPAGRSAETTFWSLLEHLREHDPTPWPEGKCRDPDSSLWGFHYRGSELFINAHSAGHQQRRSRNAVVDLMLVVQRSSNFTDLIGMHGPSRVQAEIRKKLETYDSVPLHASLQIPAGDTRCRAWKQFWVPDDNGPDERRCPLTAPSQTEGHR